MFIGDSTCWLSLVDLMGVDHGLAGGKSAKSCRQSCSEEDETMIIGSEGDSGSVWRRADMRGLGTGVAGGRSRSTLISSFDEELVTMFNRESDARASPDLIVFAEGSRGVEGVVVEVDSAAEKTTLPLSGDSLRQTFSATIVTTESEEVAVERPARCTMRRSLAISSCIARSRANSSCSRAIQ